MTCASGRSSGGEDSKRRVPRRGFMGPVPQDAIGLFVRGRHRLWLPLFFSVARNGYESDGERKMRRTILITAVLGLLLGTAFPSMGAELPRAELDESERHFTRAYDYFLERDYWNTLDYLDRALKANTYLVKAVLRRRRSPRRPGPRCFLVWSWSASRTGGCPA